MKKGRSTYTFQVNCDYNLVNNLIQSYIQANKFTLQNENGEQFYRAGDAMVEGYRYFSYSLSGQLLTIYAWVKGPFGELQIEQDGIGSMNMYLMNYRNSLNTLIQEIDRLNKNGMINNKVNNNQMNFDPMTGQPLNQNNYQQSVQNNVGNFAQTFHDETMKKQEKMCEIGFWLSIFGLLCSFVGVTYGAIIYIMNFYFASQGLKTKKKGKAQATIALSVISILIVIFQLMMA